MAAICHTYRMFDSTELDKWKWTSLHMRRENTCSFDTNATAEVTVGLSWTMFFGDVHDIGSSQHTVTRAFAVDISGAVSTHNETQVIRDRV